MLTRWKSNRAKAGRLEADQLALDCEQRIENDARARITDILTTFEALEPGWEQRLEQGVAYVLEAARIRAAIRNARRHELIVDHHGLRFQASSLFLRDCHKQLTSDPTGNERLHLVSGTVSNDGVRVLSRIVDVALDKASPAYVRADPHHTHKTLVQLVEHDGHELFAMFHSHIMHGAQSTRPSGVDIANQARFCAGGWDEVIGGIFSLDGYLRLFSTAHDFTIAVYGKGAEIVSKSPRETIIKLAIGAAS